MAGTCGIASIQPTIDCGERSSRDLFSLHFGKQLGHVISQ
jgi:hypothetical protein